MADNDPVLPLKEWRVSRYLTYRELAKRAGVSTETLQRGERGGKLNDITRRKIADALGVRVSQIAEFAHQDRPHDAS